ncbi:MAG: hypothetical protein JW923_07115 [Spirochaetales bacterium]|nr:hypothetical protein [Spirochaetales bacterium]MBP7262962.1 hypothetical protein [Spirochaetia bacterium]
MKRKRAAGAVALLVLLASLSSCVSTQRTSITKKDLPDPSVSTLVFGYLGHQTMFGVSALQYCKYYQVNPDSEARVIDAIRPSSVSNPVFFLDPVAVGSSWQLLYFQMTSGNTITYFYLGMVGKDAYDFRAEKPGLLYIGSHMLVAGATQYSMQVRELVGGEEEALEAIRPQFKGTAWEAVIDQRLKELKS